MLNLSKLSYIMYTLNQKSTSYFKCVWNNTLYFSDFFDVTLACDDSDTSHIQISTDLSGVGLDENELDSGFTMFPNPTSDEVEITLNNNFYSGDITVFVHNLMGQEMKSFQAEEANGAERFSVRAFTNGVYIVTIRDEEGVQHTGKLVVQH